MSTVPRRTALRTAAAVVVAGAAGGTTAACTFTPGPDDTAATEEPHEVVIRQEAAPTVLDPAIEPSLAASRALLERATAATLHDEFHIVAPCALLEVVPREVTQNHLGIERREAPLDVPPDSEAFPHAPHLAGGALDCDACHSVESHGEPAFDRADCASCRLTTRPWALSLPPF